jgi:hypothetical protein
MNKVRFLTKIALTTSVLAALIFTTSCSDDKEDSGGTGKWCVLDMGEEQYCFEIGARFIPELDPNRQKMTKETCDVYGDMASIQDEKPDSCEVRTE